MDFVAVGKVAMELGIIPTVALFLVWSMHLQNRKLTEMLDKREQASFELLKELIGQVADYKKQPTRGGR